MIYKVHKLVTFGPNVVATPGAEVDHDKLVKTLEDLGHTSATDAVKALVEGGALEPTGAATKAEEPAPEKEAPAKRKASPKKG